MRIIFEKTAVRGKGGEQGARGRGTGYWLLDTGYWLLDTGLDKKRIDYVQKMTDYFTDLEMEYDFYRQLHGHKIKIDGSWHQYRIISSFRGGRSF